jgi:hypothetical protein
MLERSIRHAWKASHQADHLAIPRVCVGRLEHSRDHRVKRVLDEGRDAAGWLTRTDRAELA